ncbi:MAG: Tex-like N-terminal domain-containing protein [Thermogutta sp.]
MVTTEVTISFHGLARELHIPQERVEAVIQLLDAGNTVPFITRYRKDQTGGLDEEQIRTIQSRVAKLRQLAERKQTILRAIEAQNKLTPALAKKILAANNLKRLDDLYLPFRPKKQTLATLARERGLGHLAEEILNADPICADLDKRAADYINPDKQILSGADALLGAGHILAELFSENAALRARLREILKKTGVIRTLRVAPETPSATNSTSPSPAEPAGQSSASPPTAPGRLSEQPAEQGSLPLSQPSSEGQLVASEAAIGPEPALESQAEPVLQPAPTTSEEESASHASAVMLAADPSAAEVTQSPETPAAEGQVSPEKMDPELNPQPDVNPEFDLSPKEEPPPQQGSNPQHGSDDPALAEMAPPVGPSTEPATERESETEIPSKETKPRAGESTFPSSEPNPKVADPKSAAKEAEKRRKEEQRIKEFADYFNFQEPIRTIPPHRVLAINRGEALKILRVKIEADEVAMDRVIEEICVPKDHPHADFLRGCARDALNRLILPSLEREIRRELTEKAEGHAVKVFARNLRRLLLQRPVRDRRVLAIDPGYRNGCKLAALDEYGNVLDHKLIYLVEKKGYTRKMAKETVCELVDKYQLTCIAIGNGSGSRLAETFVAELLENELKGHGIGYTIVNEAGASVYSTSQIGREELPNLEASYRGAVSIGRRLLDPLSELVKIDPANIGVGMYQHDLKEKHLRESLDEVVESCVNYVGVDVNTASPALLGYVSGLNKLTARRIYEYRQEHGAFRSREELKKVPGIGDATFVQAAGFLKISGGENPLDSTWIHPESYDLASRVMEKLGIMAEHLINPEKRAELAAKINQVNVESLAAELECGVFTLKDILAQFIRPGRDPREELPPPVFKQGILKLEDLSPGMELMGTVLNVVDFGAFIDIGLPNSGLIHRSRMDRNFVTDPHSVVAVGDVVRVWVVDVDRDRRRISLSLIPLEELAEKKAMNDKRTNRAREKPLRQKPERTRMAGPKESTPPDVQDAHNLGEQQRERRTRFRPRRDQQPAQSQTGRPETTSDGMPVVSRPVNLSRRQGQQRPKAPPEPLSEEVLAGKQPMRSFADLLQYFAAKGVVRPSEARTSTRDGGGPQKKNKGGKAKKGTRSPEPRPGSANLQEPSGHEKDSNIAKDGDSPVSAETPPRESSPIGEAATLSLTPEANDRLDQSSLAEVVELPQAQDEEAANVELPGDENSPSTGEDQGKETPPEAL